ncbi:F0F1 ATP synthase subunit epsilon [bacterium]|nr:F0F1 ATP synthase subunit epsilon [bacterium]
MKKVAYKINYLSGNAAEGQADRLVLRDAKTILTIVPGHAPLMSLLNAGSIEVIGGENGNGQYPCQSGLLRVDDAGCVVTIFS